jgi:ketosteroid isomerase-like protein
VLQRRSEMNNCPKCGRQVQDDDSFCRFCGAPLTYTTVPADVVPASPDDEIKNVIVKRLDGIKNRDENVVRSIIDVRRYTKFDDWPPYGRQDADTGLKNEFGAYQVLSNYDYDLTNLKVDIIGDLAIATFNIHYSGLMRGKTFEVNSRVTTILMRQDSEWKIIHEHYSRMTEQQPGGPQQQQRRRRRPWF